MGAQPLPVSIVAGDGVRLAAHRLGPEGGVPVVLIPGAFSNHAFWLGTKGTGFARALASAGREAWVLDPRGQGESQKPSRAQRWDFRDWIVHDVPAIVEAAAAGGRRAFLAGHSAGGAAALAARAASPALRETVLGLVVLATPAPVLGPARRLGAAMVRGMSLAFGRFPARRLRLGAEDELPHVMAQWMLWNLRGRWGWEGGPDLLDELAGVDVPTLAAAGSGDRVFAPPALCRRLLDRLGAPEKTFREFGTRTGCSEDFSHAGLVVSRAASREVWPELLAWMERVESRCG